jgi:hypothetical protein
MKVQSPKSKVQNTRAHPRRRGTGRPVAFWFVAAGTPPQPAGADARATGLRPARGIVSWLHACEWVSQTWSKHQCVCPPSSRPSPPGEGEYSPVSGYLGRLVWFGRSRIQNQIAWDLEFGASLDFGGWCLELPPLRRPVRLSPTQSNQFREVQGPKSKVQSTGAQQGRRGSDRPTMSLFCGSGESGSVRPSQTNL